MSQEYSIVGKRVPRVDGAVKVTGEARYTVDRELPRMLYGKILRSPYPHAKILNIDVSKAQKLPGVKAILTGKDTAGIKFGLPTGYPFDESPLATDKVRYVGDDVAAVAAIDEDLAEEALELIEVEYEELPAVFDPEEAMKPDASKIHEDAENNISASTSVNLGDLEKAFRESHYVREDRFVRESRVAHAPMEPHGILASFDSTGKLNIWVSCMSIFSRRLALANALNIPEGDIRISSSYVGGAFGGKISLRPFEVCAVLLSKKTGRPVKIVLTREEEFTAVPQSNNIIMYLKTGVRKDGTLLAQEIKAISESGGYRGGGGYWPFLAYYFFTALYRVPNMKYDGYAVYVNKPLTSAFRSFSGFLGRFAIDSQLDMIAQELGMDPVEIRLKNAVQRGDKHPPSKDVLGSCGLSECIKKASESAGWKEKRGQHVNRGLGIGTGACVTGAMVYPFASAAVVKLDTDGKATLFIGMTEQGGGGLTIMAQVAAEELGIGLDNIKIVFGDTETTPIEIGSFIGAAAYCTGNAVKAAAADAKRQLVEIAADKLEANIQDLEAKDGRIYVKGSPQKGIFFSDAIMASIQERGGDPIIGKGFDRVYPEADSYPNTKTAEGHYTPGLGFTASVAEVEVDTETGKVRVHKVTTAHDCGFCLNPQGLEGQIEGQTYMGQGIALLEEVIIERGKVFNPSFLDYECLTSLDVPEMETVIVESMEPTSAFGCKEAGEAPVAGIPGAIANAIYDAIGVRFKEFPITPEKILEGLQKKEGKKERSKKE